MSWQFLPAEIRLLIFKELVRPDDDGDAESASDKPLTGSEIDYLRRRHIV